MHPTVIGSDANLRWVAGLGKPGTVGHADQLRHLHEIAEQYPHRGLHKRDHTTAVARSRDGPIEPMPQGSRQRPATMVHSG
jgi:hypothetical protein